MKLIPHEIVELVNFGIILVIIWGMIFIASGVIVLVLKSNNLIK